MTRRPLAALALAAVSIVLLVTPPAGAQDGYSGGWDDPEPTGSREGKPLAYLDDDAPLGGRVGHQNGIANVSAVLVPDPDNPAADGCDARLDDVAVTPDGSTAVFLVSATFPCNLVYELRATAQANASGGVTPSTPPPYAMPLFVAVAIPPAPVSEVEAILEVDGDERVVTLEWPDGPEPDLLGYVVTRTTGGDVETLGQVDAGDRTRWVDDDPPIGKTSTYAVTAVRNGPDDEIEQVPAQPTSVEVDVPPERGEAATDDGGTGTTAAPADPQIAGEQAPSESQNRPDPGLLSSVNRRGARVPISPPTTLDTGFSETIDYPEPGAPDELAASPSGDAAVVATFEETDPMDPKQKLSFIAGGLAVLVGAATILTVTRRAARDAY